METLGNISYGLLLFVSASYILGIRRKSADTLTLFVSLFYTSFVAIIPAADMNFLHALWVLPAPILLGGLLTHLSNSNRFNLSLIKKIVDLYASILRVGVSNKREDVGPIAEPLGEIAKKDISYLEDNIV